MAAAGQGGRAAAGVYCPRPMKRLVDLKGEAALVDRIETPGGPDGAYVAAIRTDWAAVPGNEGQVPGAAVNFERASFFGRAWLARYGEGFASYVGVRTIVKVDPLSARYLPLLPRLTSTTTLRAPSSRGSLPSSIYRRRLRV